MSAAQARMELERVLSSDSLHDSPLLRRFLEYIVTQTLAGEGGQLKEYRVGVEVFDRRDSFDPRIDPVVRMSARRLRQKLQEYYEQQGQQNPVRIEIPKGGYAAVFRAPAESAGVAKLSISSISSRIPSWGLAIWAMAGLLVMAAIPYSLYLRHPRPAQAGPGKVMLAVLPFANLSGDPQQDYFSDGVTEEFIARLGNLDPQYLGVIARTSVMSYRNTGKHIDQIGRELGVQYVLEGSVRRSGAQARITAQLIQAGDQTHLWSRSYDGDDHNLLDLESKIAEAAAAEISASLRARGDAVMEAGSKLAQMSTQVVDPEAHELYLQGRYFWNKRSTANILKGLDYFQSAAKKDPNYALAYLGVAEAYAMLAANDQAPAADAAPKARAAAERALAVDGSLAEAHAVLAHVKFFYDWDFAGAETEYREALRLDPGSADAHHLYGVMLMWIGRLDEAAGQMREAEILDPLSATNSAALGLDYLFMGKNDLAMRQAGKTLETAPDDAVPHVLLGFCYERNRRYADAVEEIQKGVTLSHRDSETLGWMGWVLARSGRREEARKVIAELARSTGGRYSAAHDIAMVYAGLGQDDLALQYLNQAITRREADALDIKMEFAWESVRSDARFQALLRRSGLAE